MIEIETIEELDRHLAQDQSLDGVVLQGLDLRDRGELLCRHSLAGAVLLGCQLDPPLSEHSQACGALLFPVIEGLPYSPYRGALYTVEELYDRFEPARPASYRECLDARVYEHWRRTGGAQPPSVLETLARRLHDHAITDALEELLHPSEGSRRVVAIMGGHSMERGRGAYADVATIARSLAREGLLLATGGGPGAMEAANLGPWLAAREDADLGVAIDQLAAAPSHEHPQWLAAAFDVRARFPLSDSARQRFGSLAIPTWLYGHEPPNAFAAHVAKYFANSVREDGLLAIAQHGVVFAPGSAGTIQEIFQDACQNHYVTTGVASPMVFFGVDYWTRQKPVYPLLEQLAAGREYAEWLSITDDPAEVVDAIMRFGA